MKYHVSVGGREIEVRIDGEEVLVGGERVRAALQQVGGTPLVHLLLDGTSWVGAVEARGRGEWTILDRGESIEVEVLDERSRHIRNLIGSGAGQTKGEVLKAPMPGLVLRVLVEPGAVVKAGQGIVVLEAMKMENELKVSADGVVTRVGVRTGEAVEKGVVLVEVEAPAEG